MNWAVFGGEITFITRGRGHQRAAAIVPAELVERYEALADLDAGASTAIGPDEVARAAGAVKHRCQVPCADV